MLKTIFDKNINLTPYILCFLFFFSCQIENSNPIETLIETIEEPDPIVEESNGDEIQIPDSYSFSRNEVSTISFSGQTARIGMAEELISSLVDENETVESLLEKLKNQDANGNEVSPFEEEALNNSTKSVFSKIAASHDLFSANTVVSNEIKQDFESWIENQVNEVFENIDQLATAGVAGQIADGSAVRYVSAKGFEYNQFIGKGLIGALMVDQVLNNYLSPSYLDQGTQRKNNTNKALVEDKNYTAQEHYWDEAFGYVFGASENPIYPLDDLGSADSFLNKYIDRVDSDSDFAGTGQALFDAFLRGRAAIVANNYDVRDEEIKKIRKIISDVIAIRAVYYLQAGSQLLKISGDAVAYGSLFHDVSEGYGFVYSLRFLRNPETGEVYFTNDEVNEFLNQLSTGNGFWEVTSDTLDTISEQIASRFDFTITQASN